jgi:hypothetical protein
MSAVTEVLLRRDLTLTFGDDAQFTGDLLWLPETRALVFDSEDDPEVLTVNLAAYGFETPEGHVTIAAWNYAGIPEQLEAAGIAAAVDLHIVGPFGGLAYVLRVLTDAIPEEGSDADAHRA